MDRGGAPFFRCIFLASIARAWFLCYLEALIREILLYRFVPNVFQAEHTR